MITWLADTLRSSGLRVVEIAGWKTRGRPGNFGPPRGVILHHTGAGSSEGLRDLITNGRKDLPGPLSHLFLDRDGTFYVVAAGRCNHAGPGYWQGTTLGNGTFIGIEAANSGDGKEEWPQVQLEAYAHGVAALLEKIGADTVMAIGHKEWARPKGRKVDPSFDMMDFREHVAAVRGSVMAPHAPIATTNPLRDMLQKGDHGVSVRELQNLLGIKVDGAFGPKTEAAVIAFQKSRKLAPDGKVGPKTWSALGVQ